MPVELDPRTGGEYANELIAHGLQQYDSHKALLMRNALQSGYTMGNVPTVADTSPTRELVLQLLAQDTTQPMATRIAAIREITSIRGQQNA